jgi:IclR family pca regulon transcriptional regulator
MLHQNRNYELKFAIRTWQGFMPATPDKNSVHSLAKGFRVLEAFTAERTEMGLAEVARAASIDNATAFRFLNTLVQLGYVEKIPEAKRFRLTLKCIDLGFNAIARTDLREFARPLLRELLNDTIEAASIAVPDGPDLVYVERVQAGLVRLGVDVRIGSRVPAYSTAIGQAVLAHLPRETQIRLLEAAPRRRLTSTTLTGLDALLARLDQVRNSGFALSDQENVSGLRVLAAPVLDADGIPVAALSVAAPAFAIPLKTFSANRKPVMAAAAKLSRAVQAGGAGVSPAKLGQLAK